MSELAMPLFIGGLIALAVALFMLKRGNSTAPASPAKPATAEGSEAAMDDVRRWAGIEVTGGLTPRDEIIEFALEMAEDDYPDVDFSASIPVMVDELLREHARVQATWPEVTDCDKVDRAFELMEQRGLVARQNFEDCQTCGHAAIGGEISEALKTREVFGYTFYHQQDTERAVEAGDLWLAFGSPKGDKKTAIRVAETVVECLREAGLEPSWNGDVVERVSVPVEWQRRR
jgi:hypothetical protein